MIVNNIIPCRDFVLCVGSMTSNEIFNHSNSGGGSINQALYIYSGDVTAVGDNAPEIYLAEDKITDVSSLAEKAIAYKAGSNGTHWVAINPNSTNTRFNIEQLNSGGIHTIATQDKEKTILCIKGTITANNKNISELQFATIAPGKQVEVDVPNNSVAVILTEQ